MSRARRKPQHKILRLVDIIILVYGRFDLLRKCLDSIPAAFGDIPYQVVLWDNASPVDGKEEFYKEIGAGKDYKIHLSKDNLGYSAGNNQAFRRFGTSPLTMFLNSDVVLREGSGQALVRALDDPAVGIVGMKLIFPTESVGLDMRIRPPGRLQHIGLSMNITGDPHHMFVSWRPDHPKVLKVQDVHAVTGAAFMTRSKLFRKVGGFFEGYGMGTFEDLDLCVSVREQGNRVIISQDAVGEHYTNASASTYGIGFPLMQNKQLFFSRWQHRAAWTDYLYY
jgi:GT2 family glycosyltransferase